MLKFAEFAQIRKQLEMELITEAEFLLKVQLGARQQEHLRALTALPYKAAIKVNLADLDE